MHTTYGRKLTESVMGLLFAAAAGPVKLHTGLPDTKNLQVRVHYQEKLYTVMTCGNTDQKFVGKISASKTSLCFAVDTFSGSDRTRSSRSSVAPRAR
jgi:hypothetical protein